MPVQDRLIGKTDGEYFVKVGEIRSEHVYQSTRNRYYVGRTGIFPVQAGQQALVVLNNPSASKRKTFMHIMSITSNVGRRSVYWFDIATPHELTASSRFAITHRGVERIPETSILFATDFEIPITGGIDVFERLLVGKQTMILDQEGKFILEPGHNHAATIPALDQDDEIDVAFGWWEEPLPRNRRPNLTRAH